MKLRLGVLISAICLANCGGGGGGGDLSNITERNTHPPVTRTASGSFSSTTTPFSADSDVNDANTTPVSNNTRDNAQAVPEGSIIAGYLNTPGEGPEGPLFGVGDASDFYYVRMEENAHYEMAAFQVTEFNAEGAMLNLYSVASNTLVSSGIASVTAPAAGNYFLQVTLARGAANYILRPGVSGTSTTSARSISKAGIVPGDVIVKFKTAANARSQYAGVHKYSLNKEDDRNALSSLNVSTTSMAARSSGNANADHISRTLSVVEQLKQRPDVEYATVNHYVYPLAIPNDPLYEKQWDMPLMNLPKAWDLSQGEDVIVAVVDTGVALSHPDLKDNLLPGCDFTKANAVCSSGSDPGGDYILNGKSLFHGTHVAGTIAAVSNNQRGISGVAGKAKIMPLRVLDAINGGTDYDIMQACLYAAKLPNSSGTVPTQKASVINMSLGSVRDSSPYEADVLQQVSDAGVIVIAAAGNDGTYAASYPAAYETVVSVASVDRNLDRAPYSTLHDSVDVAAPGGDESADLDNDGTPDGVLSTHAAELGKGLVSSYNVMQGTSMASPHVAGVAALMKSIYPGLTPLEFRGLLMTGKITRDIGQAGHDASYGWGIIDAYKAVIEAARLAGVEPAVAPPELLLSATSIDFNKYRQVATLNISNGGLGTLSVSSVTASAGWLTITPVDVDSDGLGQYELMADRSGLVDGKYDASVLVQSSSSNQTVSVTLTQSSAPIPESLGYLHLQVTDMATSQPSLSLGVDTTTKNAFTFSVPEGDYLLNAFQDTNGNGIPCEFSELCSSNSADSKVGIRDGDRSGLNLKLDLIDQSIP